MESRPVGSFRQWSNPGQIIENENHEQMRHQHNFYKYFPCVISVEYPDEFPATIPKLIFNILCKVKLIIKLKTILAKVKCPMLQG